MAELGHSIRAATQITNHWYDRPGWHRGRLFDTWHIVFNDSAELRDLAARCRVALALLPGIDLVPREWLHMTIQGVGWSDEITDDDRNAVLRAANEGLRDLGELVLQLGPPLVKGEALVLPASPVDGLHELRSRLRAAISAALGYPAPVAAEQAEAFLPHVSIAYSRRDANAAPYAAALSTISPDTVRVTVRAVAFIRQERLLSPHWLYRWDELARVPIAP